MTQLAFVIGLCISAVGVAGMLAPSGLVWLAGQFDRPGAFYAIAAVRIAFGLILIATPPTSRMPRALRTLGYIIVILGLSAAVAGFAAIGPARGAIEWWMRQGAGIIRLTSVLVLALGGFVAYACRSR
jgi:hypothetical protein